MSDFTKLKLRRPLILIVLYGGFFIFLMSTDPRKLAVGWLIVPFIWLFFSLFLTFIYVIDWWTLNHRHDRRQTVLAAVLAAIPTMLLLLDSVDQLTIKDSLLIIVLGGLALFYTNKISLKNDVF